MEFKPDAFCSPGTALMPVIFLLAAVGCSPSGNGDQVGGVVVMPPKHEIVDPGQGEPNQEPLLPLRPGMTWWQSSHSLGIHVGSPVRLGSTTVYPLSGDGQVDWFSVADEGVLYHGNSHAGPKPRPLLWIPSTVRVGMRWNAWFDDNEPAIVGEVIGKIERDTLWGRCMVWHIRRVDPRGNTDTSEVWYAEGRGMVNHDSAISFHGGVLPLSDTTDSPAPQRLVLTPLNDGDPILEATQALHISALDDGVSQGLRVRVDGLIAVYSHVTWLWEFVQRVSCLQLHDLGLDIMPGLENAGLGTVACPDACQVLFKNDGTYLYEHEGSDLYESLKDDGNNVYLEGEPYPFKGEVEALFEADQGTQQNDGMTVHRAGRLNVDGQPRFFGALNLETGKNGRHIAWGWGPPIASWEADSTRWDFRSGDAFLPMKYNFTRDYLGKHVVTSVALPMDVETSGFGIAPRFGPSLGFARFDGETIRDASPGLLLDGDLSSIITPEGRRYFAVGYGGRVQEIAPAATKLQWRHVADLDLPPGHALVGAFVHQNELVAFSLFNQDPRPIGGTTQEFEPRMGDVYAWTASLDVLDELEVVPAMGGIRVKASGVDVEVCWPLGQEATVLDGWTLAGEDAEVVTSRIDGSCVTILRPLGRVHGQKRPDFSGNNTNLSSMIAAGQKWLKKQDFFIRHSWRRVHSSMFLQLNQGVIHEPSMDAGMDVRVHPCARRSPERAVSGALLTGICQMSVEGSRGPFDGS